jgi:hypothetical protein
MILHGTSLKGEKNCHTKLTEDDVRTIRRRAKNGEARSALAREFHLYKSTIRLIVARITWKHV